MISDQKHILNTEHEVTLLMIKIKDEFKTKSFHLGKEPVFESIYIAFRLGIDYYTATWSSLDKNLLFPATATARCLFELIIDMLYIHDNTPQKTKQDRYAKDYVGSVLEFKKKMLHAAAQKDLGVENVNVKNVNPWTNASLPDRIEHAGPIFSGLYDLLSYGNHPNPGMILYTFKKELGETQAGLVRIANIINALMLMRLTVTHGGIKSVTLSELQALLSPLLDE
jgi:hypothetical protein